MHEEMEYAEMLEIPVTTVNVVKKRGRKPKKTAGLKEKVISKVNDGAGEETATPPTDTAPASETTAQTESAPQTTNTPTESELPVETAAPTTAQAATETTTDTATTPSVQENGKRKRSPRQKQTSSTAQAQPTEDAPNPPAEDAPQADAIDETAVAQYVAESVPVHIPRRKKVPFFARLFGKKAGAWETGEEPNSESEETTAPVTEKTQTDTTETEETDVQSVPAPAKKEKYSLVLGLEFAAACALCLGIFLTNVFMPNSAINTFFRFLGNSPVEADARTYADFTLSGVIYEEGTELLLSETGVLSFTDAGCVYPAVDGTVTDVLQESDGSWTIKISHSPSFSEIISGLSYAPLQVGDIVKSNIPVGYSDGQREVQVTMYESGELLNCFHVTESGELAWTVEE